MSCPHCRWFLCVIPNDSHSTRLPCPAPGRAFTTCRLLLCPEKLTLSHGKGRASLPAPSQGVWGPALGAPGSAREGGMSRMGCHCWGVTAGMSLLECYFWGTTAGVSLMGCHCWGIIFGVSLSGCHCWSVISEMSLLRCHCWGVTFGVSFLGCHCTRGDKKKDKSWEG